MTRLLQWIGGLLILGALGAGFVAYFVTSTDPATGGVFDGLGRRLTQSPLFMRLIFGQERLWAGWLWFVVDMLVFWGAVGLGALLISHSEKSAESRNRGAA